MRFQRNDGMDALVCSIVRGDFGVEVKFALLVLVLLENGDAGVVAGGFNRQCEERAAVRLWP